MEVKMQSNYGMDLAWLLLRANKEFRNEANDIYKKSESDYSDSLTIGRLEFKRYRTEDEALRKKWGILNAPNCEDFTGNNVFWDPSVSTNSVEAKTCKSAGLSLSDILCIPHIKVTGAIFELSGKCMIKIIHGFQFYQLVLASADGIDHIKTIQLCLPMAEDFPAKVKTAQSLWRLLKEKPTEAIDKVQSAKESLLIAKSIEEGASHKEIALRLFGAKSVSKNWTPDGWMRAKTRYSINKTKELIQGGYRKLI